MGVNKKRSAKSMLSEKVKAKKGQALAPAKPVKAAPAQEKAAPKKRGRKTILKDVKDIKDEPSMQLVRQILSPAEITDAEFWAVFSKNHGLYSYTAKELSKMYGIEISRQFVYVRAQADPEQLQSLRDEWLDEADKVVRSLTKTAFFDGDKLKAAEMIYKRNKVPGFTPGLKIEAGAAQNAGEGEDKVAQALSLKITVAQ